MMHIIYYYFLKQLKYKLQTTYMLSKALPTIGITNLWPYLETELEKIIESKTMEVNATKILVVWLHFTKSDYNDQSELFTLFVINNFLVKLK